MTSETNTNYYPGSCHCGAIQYQIRLTLPPTHDPDRNAKTVRLYKCNCTLCHKAGFFHCRPITIAEDFILTKPSPSELGDYKNGWYFCKSCGVRTFTAFGSWTEVEIDVGQWQGCGRDGTGSGVTEKVWIVKPGPERTMMFNGQSVTRPLHYLSVNAVTLEGVNLREWHEKGWMFYINRRDEEKPMDMRVGEPHEGGMY
jgi:hypothetical protein